MKLLNVLSIVAIMLMLLLVSMNQEKNLERLERRITSIEQSTNQSIALIRYDIKLDSQRITNIENPQFIQKQYKQNKRK